MSNLMCALRKNGASWKPMNICTGLKPTHHDQAAHYSLPSITAGILTLKSTLGIKHQKEYVKDTRGRGCGSAVKHLLGP